MSIFYLRYVVPVHHDTDPVWLELRLEVTVEQGVLEHVGLDRDLMTSFLAWWMWARRCRRQSGRPGQCTAVMLNFLLSLDGGWVMMAPMKMTDSRNSSGRCSGTRMVIIPSSSALILRQRLDNIGSCPDHILALVVLRGHADQAVPHQLHFLIHRLGNGAVMDIFAEADLLHWSNETWNY